MQRRRYSCPICKVSFPNPQILARHVVMPHRFGKGARGNHNNPAADQDSVLPGSLTGEAECRSSEGNDMSRVNSTAPSSIIQSTPLQTEAVDTTAVDEGQVLHDGVEHENQQNPMSIDALVHMRSDELSGSFRDNLRRDPVPNTSSSNCLTLSTLVYEFYEEFKDVHKSLWSNVAKPTPILPQSRALVDFCMSNRLQGSEISALYELQLRLEGMRGELRESWILKDFPKVSDLHSRVLQERRYAVRSHGWREAVITNRFGKVECGVFLPVRYLLAQIVEDYGGVQNLVGYREECDSAGIRVFSNPINSDAIRKEKEGMPETCVNPVYFSLYCDKTMLAKCGSTDGFAVRLRVDNLKGANCVWFEVGYAPILSAPSKVSAQALSDARLELFQRFLFMLLRDIVHPDYYTEGNKKL